MEQLDIVFRFIDRLTTLLIQELRRVVTETTVFHTGPLPAQMSGLLGRIKFIETYL